jgi:simple sugar transport system substrate-binding protein
MMNKQITGKVSVILIAILAIGLLGISGFGSSHKDSEKPVQIMYLVGGPAGGPFASVKAKGARDAAKILGDKANVKIRYGTWNPQNDAKLFQEAIGMNPDGIAVIGWGAVEPFISEAVDKGIVVTTHNVNLPELEERYKAKGFGYVGQELYASGHMLGAAAARRSGLGEGDKALVWGLKTEPVRGQRTQGAIDALKEAGLEVDHIEISAEVDKDPANGIPVITGYLQSNPDTKLVITDHGALTATQEEYFKSAGFGPDEIYGAGFDLSPATARAIESGYTDLTLDQQPYLQGFLPVFQVYLSAKYQFSGLHIDTGSGLVHAGNIDQIAPLVEEGIR